MNMQCRPRGVRAAGYRARAPLRGAMAVEGSFYVRRGKKSCTASPCIYASQKKTRFLLFLPTRKSKGRCIEKKGEGAKSSLRETYD
ncbi:hypothetical protein E2C01_072007 [Portunus trituberculatus]|uniref:Uncharacterized protein n=1 Tax=Portunus trituberculatus TaxID=210409 RepID=A0A5B7HYK4_PORTR|nr:hypothetical protein [Portunus trituberculatus]